VTRPPSRTRRDVSASTREQVGPHFRSAIGCDTQCKEFLQLPIPNCVDAIEQPMTLAHRRQVTKTLLGRITGLHEPMKTWRQREGADHLHGSCLSDDHLRPLRPPNARQRDRGRRSARRLPHGWRNFWRAGVGNGFGGRELAGRNRPSKPVRCGSPTLARFDSGAAPPAEVGRTSQASPRRSSPPVPSGIGANVTSCIAA
jgi:hypothetical protein